MLSFLRFICLSLPAIAILTLTMQTSAQVYDRGEHSDWVKFASQSGLYSLRLPRQHDVETNTLRMSQKLVAVSEKVHSELDQRPYKKAVKNYIVKVDQTFGPALSERERNILIKREVANYTAHYRPKEALFLKKDIKSDSFKSSADISLVFDDPDLGPQGVRIFLLISDSTKLQQIIAGPDQIIESRWSQDFFDSLRYHTGAVKIEGTFASDWKNYMSPLELFTATLPEKTDPYVTEEPQFEFSDAQETMTFSFYDPVRLQRLFYNVYGYHLDDSLGYKDAEELLLSRHISKYKKSPKGININREASPHGVALTTKLRIDPPEEARYADTVHLRAFFIQNYMVVQEMVGSKMLMTSDMAQNAFSLINFHPDKAYELQKKKKNIADNLDEIMKNKSGDFIQIPSDDEASAPVPDQDMETTE